MALKSILRKNFSIILICILTFLNNSVWLFTIPYNEAPDECNHYGLSLFYLEHKRLPVYFKDEEATIPDRVNCIESSYSIFPGLRYQIDSVFMFIGNKLGINSGYLYIIPRFLSNIYIVSFICISYFFTKLLLKDTRKYLFKIVKFRIDLRLIVPITMALIPNITFLGSYVNLDSFSIFISALFMYATIKFMSSKTLLKSYIIYSIILSLTFYSKYNYYALFPVAGIILLYKFRKEGLKELIKFICVIVPIFLTIVGWWFIRNWILYKDFLGNRTFWGVYSTLLDSSSKTLIQEGLNPVTLLYKTHFIQGNMMSFIGVFGRFTIKLPTYVYYIIYAFLGIPVFMTLTIIIKKTKKILKDTKSRLLTVCFIGIWVLSIGLSIYNSLTNDFQPQGRYLYTALLPTVVLLLFGSTEFLKLKKNWKIILNLLFIVFFLVINIYSFLKFIVTTYH